MRDLEGLEVVASPFRSLGGKGRMVRQILEQVPSDDYARWVEPFAGTCVVGFTERPARAVFNDSLPYVMEFFRMLKEGRLNPQRTCLKLKQEYEKVAENADYYGEVAKRLKKKGNPLDYLFLSKTCYGGATRFSARRFFNATFSNRIPSAKDVRRTLSRILAIREIMTPEWEFRIGTWRVIFAELNQDDMLYCDPPYFGLSTGYWPPWGRPENEDFITACRNVPCPTLVTLWLERGKKRNPDIRRWEQNGYRCLEIPIRDYMGKNKGLDALLVRV